MIKKKEFPASYWNWGRQLCEKQYSNTQNIYGIYLLFFLKMYVCMCFLTYVCVMWLYIVVYDSLSSPMASKPKPVGFIRIRVWWKPELIGFGFGWHLIFWVCIWDHLNSYSKSETTCI
jgi:hypothetical protein